jgi:hypothetical protein
MTLVDISNLLNIIKISKMQTLAGEIKKFLYLVVCIEILSKSKGGSWKIYKSIVWPQKYPQVHL